MKKFLLVILSLCLSCTNEIAFDLSNEPATLIVNALLFSDESENKITLALTGYKRVAYITDARVDIVVNGELKESITKPTYHQKEPNSSPGDYITHLHFAPGDRVKIEATTSDKKHHAWAEVIVPAPVYMEQIDTTTSIINTAFNESLKYIHFKLTFLDDTTKKNYYRVEVERVQTVFAVSKRTGCDTTLIIKTSETLLHNEDIVLTDGKPTPINGSSIFDSPENRYGVFDDSRIHANYTMSISAQYFPYWQEIYYGVHEQLKEVKKVDMKLDISLHGITESEYFYLRALNFIDSEINDSPFAEPIKLPSNVSGGIGVVGVSTKRSHILLLESYVPVRMS